MEYHNNLPFNLKTRYLYTVYWVVPLALVLVAIDMLWLESYIQKTVQTSNTQILLIGIVFGAPHILASMFAYCDKEYLSFYRPNIIGGLSGGLALAIVTLFILPINVGLTLLTIINMHHFIGQQAGVARMFMRQPVRYFGLWQAALLSNSCIIAIMVGFGPNHNYLQYLPNMYEVLAAYAVFTTLLSVYIVRQVKQWRQAVYFMMTQAMSLIITLLLLLDYAFLVVLLPNFVHDVTAYLFYTRHDANRREKTTKNLIYRWFNIRSSWIVVLLPVASFILALIFNFFVHHIFILTITYFHYYIEGVAWKRNTLHRDNIALQL